MKKYLAVIIGLIVMVAGLCSAYAQDTSLLKERPKSLTIKKDNTLVVSMKIQYTDKGTIRRIDAFDHDNKIRYYTDFECNEKDLIARENKFVNGSLVEVKIKSYNKSDELVKENKFDSNRYLVEYLSYEYNNGKIKEVLYFTPDGKKKSHCKFHYKENRYDHMAVYENSSEIFRLIYRFGSNSQLDGYDIVNTADKKTLRMSIEYEKGQITQNSLFWFYH